MVLIRFASCSRVLGIPHPAAPPMLAARSRTGRRELSNDQAYCFDRGQRTIGLCRQLGCSGSYRLLAASNFQRATPGWVVGSGHPSRWRLVGLDTKQTAAN
jgi:hypothetical protein